MTQRRSQHKPAAVGSRIAVHGATGEDAAIEQNTPAVTGRLIVHHRTFGDHWIVTGRWNQDDPAPVDSGIAGYRAVADDHGRGRCDRDAAAIGGFVRLYGAGEDRRITLVDGNSTSHAGVTNP